MKHFIAALAFAAALAPTLAHAGLNDDAPVHPLVGLALTAGGDKLSSTEYTNGLSQDVTAGGLVYVYGGLEFRPPGSPLSVQGTIGYHFDSANATNGDQRFSRVPLEAIALYSVAPRWRVGLGARYASNAKFRSSGAGYVGDADFKSQLGLVVMGEWLITPSMGLQLRYVHETYKLGGACYTDAYGNVDLCRAPTTIDGSHAGLGFNYYF